MRTKTDTTTPKSALKTKPFFVKVPHRKITMTVSRRLAEEMGEMPLNLADDIGSGVSDLASNYSTAAIGEIVAEYAEWIQGRPTAEVSFTMSETSWHRAITLATAAGVDIYGLLLAGVERRGQDIRRFEARKRRKAEQVA